MCAGPFLSVLSWKSLLLLLLGGMWTPGGAQLVSQVGEGPWNARRVWYRLWSTNKINYDKPSMIHSGRHTQSRQKRSLFSLESCFVLIDFEKWGGRTYVQTPRAKIVTTTGRDCGWASWIKKLITSHRHLYILFRYVHRQRIVSKF